MGGKSVVYTLRKAAAEDCMVNREQLRISFVVESLPVSLNLNLSRCSLSYRLQSAEYFLLQP